MDAMVESQGLRYFLNNFNNKIVLETIARMTFKEKIEQLIDTGDKENITLAFQLATSQKIGGFILIGVDFCGADLGAAYLYGADLRGANLNKANLSNANLSTVDLPGAKLRRTNLSKTNLSNADLSDADLCNAYFKDTVVLGLDLSYADLSSAYLSDVRFHTRRDFADVAIRLVLVHWLLHVAPL